MDIIDVSKIWTKACKYLQDLLSEDVYSRWISVIDPVSLENNVLLLAVDNDFYQTWLEDNYLPLIKDAIRTVYDEDFTVKFTVKDQPDIVLENIVEKPKKTTLREKISRATHKKPQLNPKFVFDTFIVGPSNNFSHAASLAVAQAPARAYNPLFIYGETGLGKTHLMQAIGHHVISTSRANVTYLSCETLLNEYIDALRNKTLVQYRKKYRSTDLLLIDDIHFLANKEVMQEEFFHTFNALFDAHKQIVMTSDRPASEITGLERRLVSRFEWGLVTQLEHPDLETRIAILRAKQESSDIKLNDEFISFIAENVRSNVRRLEGAYVRAVSYMSLTRRELTIDSLRHLLRDTLDQEQQAMVTIDSIQRAVAEHFDVRISDLSSKCRQREVAVPRQIAMYISRRITNSSFPDIANSFNKTHATILHAYKTIDSRLDIDNDIRQAVSTISNKLGHPII